MAKFKGEVGYGDLVESSTGSGVWASTITEQEYYGDVIRKSRNLVPGQNVNPDITLDNTISIVADEYAIENFVKIKYVRWMGAYWTVTSVEVQRPRLLLTLGGVYNGPKA